MPVYKNRFEKFVDDINRRHFQIQVFLAFYGLRIHRVLFTAQVTIEDTKWLEAGPKKMLY